MAYKLYSPTTGSTTSGDIVAMLDASVPLHSAHIARIAQLELNGMSYSGEDGDVLGAALRVARSGRTAPHACEMAWVAHFAMKAAA